MSKNSYCLNKQKKIYIYMIFFLLILLLIGFIRFFVLLFNKPTIPNTEPVYYTSKSLMLDKIIIYSSANAVDNNIQNSTSLNLNIYQFSDIAIYLTNNSNTKFKKIYLENIKLITPPSIGETHVFYKNTNDFGKYISSDANIKDLVFVISDEANEEEGKNIPYIDSKFTSPITLGYINLIKNNFTINAVTFDGSILKKASIPLNGLTTSLTFDINAIDEENNLFKYSVTIDIPITDEETGENLYSNNLLIQKNIKEYFQLIENS